MKHTSPVQLHYVRDDKEALQCFTVVVPDAALLALNEGHPLRQLTIRFNGGGKPSARLFALAKAVQQAETEGLAYPGLIEVIRRKINRLFRRNTPSLGKRAEMIGSSFLIQAYPMGEANAMTLAAITRKVSDATGETMAAIHKAHSLAIELGMVNRTAEGKFYK